MEFSFQKHQLKNLSKGCKELNDSRFSEYCCALQVEVPTGLYVALSVREHNGSKIRLYDTNLARDISNDFKITRDNYEYTRVFASSLNVVNILQSMQPYSHGEVNRFCILFQAVEALDFEMKHTDVNKGVLQTVLYKNFNRLLVPLRNPWVSVTVPCGHMIMFSCFTFHYIMLHVVLYAGDRNNETLADINFEHHNSPCATVYNTSLLLIHVIYHIYIHTRVQTGFKFHFSFHNESVLPIRIADNSWNCSVPYISDFMHHLSCNKEVECHDAADEANCSYTSDHCGPGYLTMGGACFFFVWKPRSKISWNEAREMCSLRGSRLAVLNTPEKWKDAIRLMPDSRNAAFFFLGIRNTPPALPLWYTGIYQWTDTTTALYLHSENYFGFNHCYSYTKSTCGYVRVRIIRDTKKGRVCVEIGCELKAPFDILCEKPFPSQSTTKSILINSTNRWPHKTSYLECPLGHYTHQFLACDVRSSCWYNDDSLCCDSSLSPIPPSFTCSDDTNRVPYTLVCDHRIDCVDGSDEDFCDVSRCQSGYFSCDNGQCIVSTKICDGWGDCQKGEDEEQCNTDYDIQTALPPPALFSLHDNGQLVMKPLDQGLSMEETCPHTHFRCPDTAYCLPIILRCNGASDCPGREDETDCDKCPGFYRCRASKVCLQYRELCDGHPHCPQHDDELMCNTTCPASCVCRGMAFFCRKLFTTSAYPLLRFLNASGSEITPAHLTVNKRLIHLVLANCGLTGLDGLFLPNLLILEIQDNQVSSFNELNLNSFPQLRDMSVAGNPLALAFEDEESLRFFPQIIKLDLSRVLLHDLNVSALSAFPSLHVLNLSHSDVQRVQGEGFHRLQQLRRIDLRGCSMAWFPHDMFLGLVELEVVHAHSFKICCPDVLPPKFNIHNCFAPSNEISSCNDLLRGSGYGIFVFVLSLFSLAGNAVSFIFRNFRSKRKNSLGYGNFVTHLSVSDFLMGVYLAIIGVANQVHRGSYMWNDESWRHSVSCKLAGFLFFLSSETSVLMMFLITLDRFLILRFSFNRLQFSPTSAHLASFFVWIVAVILASVPLLPVTSHWEFYTHTGICIPLPIPRTEFSGQSYSFSVLIVINFVVFLFISLAQFSIFWSISTTSMYASNTTKAMKDLNIARRLITIVMSDFLCWYPTSVLGLLASNDVSVSGEINVALAIFVLPLNAAVNPCLYSFNVIMERRSRAREEKLRALLLAQMKAKK